MGSPYSSRILPGTQEGNFYHTKRQKRMIYPERPEGTRLLFYNIHLPGKDGSPGTPIGVVALLISTDTTRLARGITVRSLLDEWDAGEGRIRAAGRAVRAYKKYYGSDVRLTVSVHFKHRHALDAVGINGFNTLKYCAPAVPTPKELKLLEKRGLGTPVETSRGPVEYCLT